MLFYRVVSKKYCAGNIVGSVVLHLCLLTELNDRMKWEKEETKVLGLAVLLLFTLLTGIPHVC